MKNIKFLAVCIFLLLSTHGHAVDDTLVLNGSAMYSEISQSYYVGGLYLDEPVSDVNTILSPNTRKLMQIVVTKNDWSKRSWTRHWRNRIAINNPDATNDTDAFSALAKFTTMVKGELLRGDEIIIEYRTGMTEIRLNSETVLQSKGSAVMKYLLLTWLGNIPPSSDFRRNILNGPSGDLWESNKKLLTDYKLPSGRTALYSSWLDKDNEIKIEQERKLAEIKAAAQVQRERAELALAARKKALKEKAEREKAEKEKARRAKLAAEQNTAKSQAAKKPAVKVVAKKSNKDLARERTAEQDYYLAILQWQIQRYVFNNVEYPHWARNFSEEGLVDLKFLLNPQREVEVFEKTTNVDSMLVKEVERAVRKGVSTLTVPSKIDSDSWQLSVNYLFSLKGETLPDVLPPIMPSHLENRRVPQAEQDALIEQYRSDLVKSVQKIIVYPERAKMSRHRGRISAKVTVDRWGEVKNIEMVKVTRFEYLNDAVTTAIEQNAPFNMFPLEISEDTIVVELEHRFP